MKSQRFWQHVVQKRQRYQQKQGLHKVVRDFRKATLKFKAKHGKSASLRRWSLSFGHRMRIAFNKQELKEVLQKIHKVKHHCPKSRRMYRSWYPKREEFMNEKSQTESGEDQILDIRSLILKLYFIKPIFVYFR